MNQINIGDTFPLEERREIQAGTIHDTFGEVTPAWYIFRSVPQKEANAKAWLEIRGVEAWYPTEAAWRMTPKGKRKKVEYQKRIAPGYLFARFTEYPQWGALFTSQYLSAVISYQGQPVSIPDAVIAEMEQVPGRLAVQREEYRKARVINGGDKARITEGAMEGWIVDISEVRNGIASFLIPLLGDRITTMPVGRMSKVLDG